MIALYFVSETGQAGVHSICIGVCLKLRDAGFKVGFMKPLGFRMERDPEGIVDGDARFMRELLNMEEPLSAVNPVFITTSLVQQALAGAVEDLQPRISEAFQTLAKNRDVIVLQGGLTMEQGAIFGISGYDIHSLLDTRVVLVDRYDDAHVVDRVLVAKNHLGNRLLGVVYNMVPSVRKSFTADVVRPYLKRRGIEVLGIIPEDRVLKSTSVQDLAAALKAQVLTGGENMDWLVENVMVGSMGPEHALSFFRRRFNQCIVTGGDRADMQLAALEANAKCIILSGNLYPSSIVLAKADEMGVPMLLVEDDTLSAAEKAELLIRTARAHEPKKLERLRELMDEYVDFEEFFKLSGLR